MTISTTSKKSVSSNVFWYVKACILLNFIPYTIYWDKTLIIKKFPSASSISSISLLLHNSYMSSSARFICMWGIFHFPLFFFFVHVFVWQKHGLFDLKHHNSFQKQNNRNGTHKILLPELWFSSCNKMLENSMIYAWVGAPKKLTWRQII